MRYAEILLFSGGLDSFPAWEYLGRPPCIFFDIGHRYRQRELETINLLAQKNDMNLIVSNEINLSSWEPDDSFTPIIPLRNLYFAMLASNYADKVWCVGVSGDWTEDKNPDAFGKISELLSGLLGRSIRLDSPFWDKTKTDIVKWYLDQGLPIDNLLATYSCYSAKKIHCGRCPSCLRRWIAFVNNGVDGDFESDPLEWTRVHEYYIPAMREGRYPKTRALEFASALSRFGIHVWTEDS